MNEKLSILLILISALISFAYTASLISTRRIEHGAHRLAAHLLGAIAGLGSAFGSFCISSVLLTLPQHGFSDGATTALVIGILILCGSTFGLLPSKRRAPAGSTSQTGRTDPGAPTGANSPASGASESSAPPLSPPVAAWRGSTALVVIDTPPSSAQPPTDRSAGHAPPEPSGKPQRSLRAAVQAWWQEQKRHHAQRSAKAKQKKRARQRALGCTFGTLFDERFESHLIGWSTIAVFILWLYIFHTQNAEGSSLGIQIILSLLMTGLVTAIICASFLFILPFIAFLVIMLPFISLSIWLEAWYRRSSGQPYTVKKKPNIVERPESVSHASARHTASIRPSYSAYDDPFMNTEPVFDGYEEEEEFDSDGRCIRRRRRVIRHYHHYGGTDDDHLDTDYRYRHDPPWDTDRHTNRRSDGDWLFPLAVGLWVGSWWGDDD